MEDEFGPLLTSEQLYRRDVDYYREVIHPGTSVEYLERLQRGDTSAKDGFLCSLLPVIRGYATHLQTTDVPMLELICASNFIIVEKLEEALLHPAPIGYLLTFARRYMFACSRHFRSVITLPSGPSLPPYELLPLSDEFDIEETATNEEEQDDATPLYQALDAIPSQRGKALIARLFGLQDQDAETMQEITGGNSTTKGYQAARNMKSVYLKWIRNYLTTHAPEYVARHSRQAPTTSLQQTYYETLRIPERTQRKLETAMRALQERGETLSMNKLRDEAGVYSTHASAYLWRLRNTSV